MKASVLDKINLIIDKQFKTTSLIPISLVLKNGNIVVNGFKIFKLVNDEYIQGITLKEDYAFNKTKQRPSIAKIYVDEILEIEIIEDIVV
jgi:hypothetical protein